MHLVCAAGPEGVAAGALLARALARAGLPVAALTALSYGEPPESQTVRDWLADAHAVLVVGLGVTRPLVPGVPQLAVDRGPSGDRGAPVEPLTARAFRLGETLCHLGDATWIAALGLVGGPPHALVERALARHTHDDLERAAALLDAAARGPEPAALSLMAIELVAAASDPRRFCASEGAELLCRTQAVVAAELARAARIRPRAGFGVVVVEYESACRLEDLVAARWRGLRPGTAVLVANHGAVDGMVAVTARAAAPEALDRLRATLRDEGTTLLDPVTWAQLLVRLGVAPAVIERTAEAPFELSALPN